MENTGYCKYCNTSKIEEELRSKNQCFECFRSHRNSFMKEYNQLETTKERNRIRDATDTEREKNRLASAAWYAVPENKEKEKERRKTPEAKASQKEQDQKPERKAKKRLYDKSEKRKASRNKRRKEKRENDPVFRMREKITNSINTLIKLNGGKKGGKSCMNYLPYTIEELKSHLESQFEPWMNWDNRKRYCAKTWDDNDQSTWVWNIGHIIPKSDLPHTTMEEENFLKCWGLDNLRPLSAKQNLLDGANKTRHTNKRY